MKARKVDGLEPSGSLRANAERIVATRLDELIGLAGEALEPSGEVAQHDMRIAAKRVRYVLEIAAGCFGPEAEAAREAAKQLQGVLGEIHDCDVMLPRVAGVESVEALLRMRRELLFGRFRELWLAEETQSTLAGLGPFPTHGDGKEPRVA
jgi:CHAD domain-containing protein